MGIQSSVNSMLSGAANVASSVKGNIDTKNKELAKAKQQQVKSIDKKVNNLQKMVEALSSVKEQQKVIKKRKQQVKQNADLYIGNTLIAKAGTPEYKNLMKKAKEN